MAQVPEKGRDLATLALERIKDIERRLDRLEGKKGKKDDDNAPEHVKPVAR